MLRRFLPPACQRIERYLRFKRGCQPQSTKRGRYHIEEQELFSRHMPKHLNTCPDASLDDVSSFESYPERFQRFIEDLSKQMGVERGSKSELQSNTEQGKMSLRNCQNVDPRSKILFFSVDHSCRSRRTRRLRHYPHPQSEKLEDAPSVTGDLYLLKCNDFHQDFAASTCNQPLLLALFRLVHLDDCEVRLVALNQIVDKYHKRVRSSSQWCRTLANRSVNIISDNLKKRLDGPPSNGHESVPRSFAFFCVGLQFLIYLFLSKASSVCNTQMILKPCCYPLEQSFVYFG